MRSFATMPICADCLWPASCFPESSAAWVSFNRSLAPIFLTRQILLQNCRPLGSWTNFLQSLTSACICLHQCLSALAATANISFCLLLLAWPRLGIFCCSPLRDGGWLSFRSGL